MPLVKRDRPTVAAELETESTVESLLADLGGSDASRRRAAARQLADHPALGRTLCDALVSESDETVREALFTALIRIGTRTAAEGLVPLLQSEDVGLRNGAIEVLKTMPDAVSEHIGEIFTGTTDVRIFGVEILGALAHPEAPHWLVRVIEEDPEINVCAAAVDALVECGDAAAVEPLHALLARFPDEPFLEFSIQTALSRIAGE